MTFNCGDKTVIIQVNLNISCRKWTTTASVHDMQFCIYMPAFKGQAFSKASFHILAFSFDFWLWNFGFWPGDNVVQSDKVLAKGKNI